MTVRTTPPIPNARILVLVSGDGSNMRDLVEAARNDNWGGTVVAVGADRDCAGITWAHNQGIDTFVLPLAPGQDRNQWDQHLAEHIGAYQPDLVVCAGFLKLLGPAVLSRFDGRILNTHNSLLPAFPGTRGPADAVAAGVKLAGATLFVVDAGTDTGVILAQTAVPVYFDDDADTLLDRIKVAERHQLVTTVGAMIRGGWHINGRRSHIGVAPS
ncbi:phosphoribosylglycinamide formyltransferase [Schaalia suimastitidis]|uniref:phosphoribosylglycinamide formyltransferase n=1 Tax=Schaalia suimastitidis TaxID=121163 RepID=UPI00040C8965|nr:phosphoribosylglycinamide formyltransferase [Schaalia suimastitidis]